MSNKTVLEFDSPLSEDHLKIMVTFIKANSSNDIKVKVDKDTSKVVLEIGNNVILSGPGKL